MRLRIQHRTIYNYEEPTRYSAQTIRLTPPTNAAQRVARWSLKTDGKLTQTLDSFGNVSHMLVIDKPHRRVVIEAEGEVETTGENGRDPNEIETLHPIIYLRETPLTFPDPRLRDFALRFEQPLKDAPLQTLFDLMAGIRSRIDYCPGASNVGSTAAEVFAANAGVCQDHTHVFLTCVRVLGMPARYISGYLFTENTVNEASHAWGEAWLPEKGWLGFDVANNIPVGPTHVRIATALDYRGASPVTGVRRGGGLERMDVTVQIAQAQQ